MSLHESPVAAPDLTKFQLRVLAICASEDLPYGLQIKEELERYYGSDVNHGRLYPNLDDLAERGLIEVGQIDKRTKSYELTEAGRDVLEDEISWLDDRMEDWS